MTFSRDKNYDIKLTKEMSKKEYQITPNDPSWLDHKGKGAILDYELLKGASLEQLVLKSGRKVSAVNAHIYHLKKEHGLNIMKNEGTFKINTVDEGYLDNLSMDIKIGILVKNYIYKIFHYCEIEDRDELFRLMDKSYSKRVFGINFPFCKPYDDISNDEIIRFWKTNYNVRNKIVRVCSQWVITSKDLFLNYLLSKRIITEQEFKHYHKIVQKKPFIKKSPSPIKTEVKQARYDETDPIHQNIIIAKEKKQNNYFLSQFDLELRNEAEEMSKHYETFYCLERSIRKMIVNSMKEKYGNDWWVKKVDFNIREAVRKNMDWELDTVFSKRSKNNIDYTTFGQLRQIVKNNWVIFSKQFRSQAAFNRLMIDLNQLRVPIAHCTPFNQKEVRRLELTVDDWFDLMNS